MIARSKVSLDDRTFGVSSRQLHSAASASAITSKKQGISFSIDSLLSTSNSGTSDRDLPGGDVQPKITSLLNETRMSSTYLRSFNNISLNNSYDILSDNNDGIPTLSGSSNSSNFTQGYAAENEVCLPATLQFCHDFLSSGAPATSSLTRVKSSQNEIFPLFTTALPPQFVSASVQKSKSQPRATTPSTRLHGKKYHSSGPRQRRHRTIFTERQIATLERTFSVTHYPDALTRDALARHTLLMGERIEVWFKNRRAKWRKLRRLQHAKQLEKQTSSLATDTSSMNKYSSLSINDVK